MRLYELVDSDQEVLDIIKPILIRARAEGASSIMMSQLLNDIDSEDNITAELMVDLLNRHRKQLKNIISNSTLDTITLNKGSAEKMTTNFDKKTAQIKNIAVKKALDQLK